MGFILGPPAFFTFCSVYSRHAFCSEWVNESNPSELRFNVLCLMQWFQGTTSLISFFIFVIILCLHRKSKCKLRLVCGSWVMTGWSQVTQVVGFMTPHQASYPNCGMSQTFFAKEILTHLIPWIKWMRIIFKASTLSLTFRIFLVAEINLVDLEYVIQGDSKRVLLFRY